MYCSILPCLFFFFNAKYYGGFNEKLTDRLIDFVTERD